MPLPAIKRNAYREPDRAEVQDRAIASVRANPEKHFAAYLADPRSFGGRYVAADLFKETFDDYRATLIGGDAHAGPIYDSASRRRRSRYNSPVHNASAVLSAEQFERTCANAQPGQPAVFLTGSPGSGKTTLVLNLSEDGALGLPDNFGVVFEGQLSRPETGILKIERALVAGLSPVIIAVHTTPEKALDNTLHRYASQGRGASMKLMSEIAGMLPEGLRKIYDHFQATGERIDLIVYDNRDYAHQTAYAGWDHLPVLESEGPQQDILERHERHLEARWNAGTVSADAYFQAAGREPPRRLAD